MRSMNLFGRIRRWTALLCLALLLISGCGFLQKITGDPFEGNWIGIAKTPGIGDSLLRIQIEPAGDERYFVQVLADGYHLMNSKTPEEKQVYVWQNVAELRFTGTLENDTLHLNKMMRFSLVLSKFTGGLTLHDGTEICRDDGKKYPELQKELRSIMQKKHPQAQFKDKNES